MDQTGPKRKPGGFHEGLLSARYHEPGMNHAPGMAAAKLRRIQPVRAAAAGVPDRRAGEFSEGITKVRASGRVERGICQVRCNGGCCEWAIS